MTAAPVNAVVETERRARMAFARLTEPCSNPAREEILEYGYVAALTRVQSGASGLTPTVAGRAQELDLDREERATTLCGARVLIPGDAEWPVGLDLLEHPPHCLWVRGPGSLRELAEVGVAVVGARGSTAYGNHVAAELGYGLTAAGAVVVSGAAFGIDAAAHRGALAADGPTVAALACGVDRAYPAAHGPLLREIATGGVILSEAPPGSLPLRSRFLARNRLIAACSRGTVVVEAGRRSGSLNTAGWAVKLARPVGAVPGPVTSAASAGTNAWIREHAAELVTGTDEVMELVGRLGVDLADPQRGPERAEDALDPEELAVWEALSPTRARAVDRVATDAGLSIPRCQALLAGLEIRAFVEHDPAGWKRASSGGSH